MMQFAIAVVLSHASALDVGASMRATMHKLHTALQPATPLQEDVIDLGDGARGTVVSFEATDRDCAWCAATSIDARRRRGSSRPGTARASRRRTSTRPSRTTVRI